MTHLTPFGSMNQRRPSLGSSRSYEKRIANVYQRKSLERQYDAVMEEEQARLLARYTENRVRDAKEVLTAAKQEITCEFDQVVIFPILQAYGSTVERNIRNFGRGV